ncbi:MAG: putative lipid II flippase FtsW [Proteobacteria bacterium]|nr:putative lipid II flippase FtsW [Pseudomonadota bacterium]
MRTLRDVDPLVLASILALLAIGVAMVYSAGAIYAADVHGSEAHYIKRHAVFAVIGLCAMTGMAMIPYQKWRPWTYPMLLGVTALLVLVLVPGVGVTMGGATRWLPAGPIFLQPSELAKLALVIYLAYSLEKKQSHIGTFAIGILPHLVFAGLVLALILVEPDYGTTMTLSALLFVMMFVAGVRVQHLAALLAVALPAAWLVLMGAEYRRVRITAFLDPWAHQADSGFQLIQSWLAFRAGGAVGVGLGESQQKLFYLPAAHTDFIFSVIGEEFGLVGVLLVVCLFALFVYRAVKVSIDAPDLFGRLLGVGLGLLIGMQAGINMGVVTGLLPTKGLTLPLISYGGSSLVLTMAMLGVLLNVTAQARQRTVLATGARSPLQRISSGRKRARAGGLDASWTTG